MLYAVRRQPANSGLVTMITVKTNIGPVFQGIINGINKIKDPDYLLRPVAIEIIPQMTRRIHQEGRASDGEKIGTYSDGYMKVRTGNYGNAGVYKSGKKKGQRKDSGTFTKGNRAGQPRPKYNRNADPTVIVSLTRQLENDYALVATDAGGYGIGFNNEINFKKSGWVQETYNKKIFDLSGQEIDYAIDRINELVSEAINQI